MALKFVIDSLDGLPPAVREHYSKAEDGKFRLTLDGDHPDAGRVKEFRESAIAAIKERDALKTRFDGIDPDVVKADKAKLTAFETSKPNERIAELEGKLSAMQASANASILSNAVRTAFLATGGRPDAAEYIATKAASQFTVDETGGLVGKGFDPSKPGEKLTIEGFIAIQLRESPFAFKPSSGGGTPANPGANPSRSNELVDPTPQQLGAHAADIRAGRVKVRYSNS
jgi:hypothetical protein